MPTIDGMNVTFYSLEMILLDDEVTPLETIVGLAIEENQ